MNSCDGCTHWYVWQGLRQQSIGREVEGPVATTFVGSEPAGKIDVQHEKSQQISSLSHQSSQQVRPLYNQTS